MSAMPDLINRLRGIYTVPINDGAGPIDGKMTVTRTFDNLPPIMGEAADELDRLSRQNAELLEALQIVQPYADRDLLPWVADIVRKAISKATE